MEHAMVDSKKLGYLLRSGVCIVFYMDVASGRGNRQLHGSYLFSGAANFHFAGFLFLQNCQ